MRTVVGVVAALASLGFAVGASAQTKPAEATAPARPAQAKAGVPGSSARIDPNAVEKLLRKRVEGVEWTETPFEEVIEWLRAEGDGRVNVIPRWTELTQEQVETDTPVTLRMKDVTVGQVLGETLKALSPPGELAYHGKGNVLEIATKAYFGREMITLVYDVSDIVVRIPDFGQNAPQIDLQQAGQSGGGGGGGGGGRVFAGGSSGSEQGESGEQAEQAMKTRLEEMAKNIQETIAVDSWDLGQAGGRGRIRVQGRYLFIYNTIEIHEMIGGPVTLKN